MVDAQLDKVYVHESVFQAIGIDISTGIPDFPWIECDILVNVFGEWYTIPESDITINS
jgi:hypothetical protein